MPATRFSAAARVGAAPVGTGVAGASVVVALSPPVVFSASSVLSASVVAVVALPAGEEVIVLSIVSLDPPLVSDSVGSGSLDVVSSTKVRLLRMLGSSAEVRVGSAGESVVVGSAVPTVGVAFMGSSLRKLGVTVSVPEYAGHPGTVLGGARPPPQSTPWQISRESGTYQMTVW